MSFDEFDLLFDDLTLEPNDEQINTMLMWFNEDFIENPIYLNGVKVVVKNQASWNRFFRGMPETFVHLITRENQYTKQREFDNERANRIHWIKPILVNSASPRIKYFEFSDKRGVIGQHFWFEEKDFMVVLKQIHSDLLLITAFCIDKYERQRFRNRFNDYNKG